MAQSPELKRLANKVKGLPVPQVELTLKVELVDILLARFGQEKHLTKEIAALKDGKKLPKGSVLKDLPVYYDQEDQLIRLQSLAHSISHNIRLR